jgi:2,3-bisphosphoglycerate-independent phosphoglycerate mutase
LFSKLSHPAILIILDGWGINPNREANAIAQARTPNLDFYASLYPNSSLLTSGAAVGLPEGQMGNSEVGHMNIGTGRIVYQDLTLIHRAIEDGSFFSNPVLVSAFKETESKRKKLHLMGLIGDGGVHSHNLHLEALLKMAAGLKVERLFVHAFLDGRDTPPRSAKGFLEGLEISLREVGIGRIASFAGRYYAMDRDRRWERIKLAYHAMVSGKGRTVRSALEGIQSAYDLDETDEFVRPSVVMHGEEPVGLVEDGDVVIFFNFRADRAREFTRAMTEVGFHEFERGDSPPSLSFVCMTEYDPTFRLPVAFQGVDLKQSLGEILSGCGIRQLRIAETEKYAHVTFFFNAGREEKFPGEERILIPSPRDVATYDLKPEMSAYQVADEVVNKTKGGEFGFIVLNFANGDMVGHTGNMQATRRACEVVDDCVGRVVRAIQANGGTAMVVADHGNAEQMLDYKTGEPHTAHTTNPVPLLLIGEEYRGVNLSKGSLCDIAPTLLKILNIKQPESMKGRCLIEGG